LSIFLQLDCLLLFLYYIWLPEVFGDGQGGRRGTDGKLDFNPWEQIFCGEFDGKRKKRVLVKIIGE